MARLGRYFLPDQPLHVIQRGNNRAPIFFHDEDYARYRRWLGEAAARYGCAVHAYLLMTNHVHLLVTPQADGSLPGAMQSLGRRYVRYVNATYRRTGTLWEGRYRAAPNAEAVIAGESQGQVIDRGLPDKNFRRHQVVTHRTVLHRRGVRPLHCRCHGATCNAEAIHVSQRRRGAMDCFAFGSQ